MSKSIIVGSTLAVFGLGGLAFGAWQVQQAPQGPQFADITAVTPVTETVSTPREVCENVQVTRQAPTRDPHSILGSAAGAVVAVSSTDVSVGEQALIASASAPSETSGSIFID